MRARLMALLIAVPSLLPGPPALGQAPTSMETELSVKKPCRIVKDDGEVGDYALVRCPGPAGLSAYTEAGPSRVSLSFRWGKARSGSVVAGFSLGDKLEWRGRKGEGRFKPYAVIVRVVERDSDSIDNEGNDRRYNVLGVIRVGARNACLMAVIDEQANADARMLARATADAEAASFQCGVSKPRIVGKATVWAQAAVGHAGGPLK